MQLHASSRAALRHQAPPLTKKVFMNGKKAKAIRRMAREELENDANTVDRRLVGKRHKGSTQAVNDPLGSVRGFTLGLKRAYNNLKRGG